MAERPAASSSTDLLLSLVLDELQGLRADLSGAGGGAAAAVGAQSGTTELREPVIPGPVAVTKPAAQPAPTKSADRRRGRQSR